jgi:hypothetical protein
MFLLHESRDHPSEHSLIEGSDQGLVMSLRNGKWRENPEFFLHLSRAKEQRSNPTKEAMGEPL